MFLHHHRSTLHIDTLNAILPPVQQNRIFNAAISANVGRHDSARGNRIAAGYSDEDCSVDIDKTIPYIVRSEN